MSVNLPAKYQEEVPEVIPEGTIENFPIIRVRAQIARWLVQNVKSGSLRRAAIEEISHALVMEDYRRKELLIRKKLEENIECQRRTLERRQRFMLERALDSKKFQLARAEIYEKMALRVANTKRYLALASSPIDAQIKRAEQELARTKAEQALRRHLQKARMDEIKNQTLHRAQFLKEVRAKYPDMEAEIMDSYDRGMYEFNQSIMEAGQEG